MVPAEGVRTSWEDVPEPVRAAVTHACGAAVVDVDIQRSGFSPGIAARIRCADGARYFIKGGTREVNAYTVSLHRQEREVLHALRHMIATGCLSAARLHGAVDFDPWFVLILDDIDGRHPELPWRLPDLRRVVDALDRLADTPVPASAAIPPIAHRHADSFTGWRLLRQRADDERIDPWWRERIGQLARLEATWSRYAGGSCLLHVDVRADNLLLTDDRVVFVDWPHACRGAAFVEPVLLAPSVAMQGGPAPAEVLAMSRRGRNVPAQALAAVVCALAGYFTERSLRPAPPGLPGAREFQAAQGQIARQWLRDLL